MRKESTYNESSAENVQTSNGAGTANDAFQYLKSLPRNHERPALDSYKRERGSQIVDDVVAELFTSTFRGTTEPFYIPVSWTMTKTALVNLLGITDYEGEEVSGIRFYAGLNCNHQLTLIAVSTSTSEDCDDDLTVEEQYPYYDYADPCPSSCSRRGNLKAATPEQKKVVLTL
jgi:hypothetical protein